LTERRCLRYIHITNDWNLKGTKDAYKSLRKVQTKAHFFRSNLLTVKAKEKQTLLASFDRNTTVLKYIINMY
jgi:hypothetical protein